MIRLISVSLLLLTVGCDQEYVIGAKPDEQKVDPRIVVSPQSLNFPDVPPDEVEVETFTITNGGGADLLVSGIEVTEGVAQFTLLSSPEHTLGSGEKVEIDVQYTPMNLEDSGSILITSNDSAQGQTWVDLFGNTFGGELEIRPNPLDFEEVDLFSTEERDVRINNISDVPVLIDEVAVSGSGFAMTSSLSLPLSLDPGQSVPVMVSFTPQLGGGYSGDLTVHNDGGADPLIGALTGIGSETSPQAICSVSPNPVQPIHESATFFGSNSDSGGGSLVTYQWSLVNSPPGSSATFPGGNSPDRSFTPDLAGTYEADLRVQNSAGLWSDPCRATLQAVPVDHFWVEMFWQYPGDDMDLHVLEPGGALETEGDCYYWNCTPTNGPLDWGQLGLSTDNPVLDIDDIPGTGPENINIDNPSNGVYTIIVRDYPLSDYPSSNNVTVNIYLDGSLVWADTRPLSGEGGYEYFATVSWPSLTVTSL